MRQLTSAKNKQNNTKTTIMASVFTLRSSATVLTRIVVLVLVMAIQLDYQCCYAKDVGLLLATDELHSSASQYSSSSSVNEGDVDDDVEGGVEKDIDQSKKMVKDVCTCETASTPQPPIAPSYAEIRTQDHRIGDVEEKLVSMETRLKDAERSSSQLKKLAMAAMSVALADEGERCPEAEGLGVQQLMKGFPAFDSGTFAPTARDYCEDLGTITKPATSCNQLKLACDKPSGTYFVDNSYFTQVYCEMTRFGGGWTRYGKADMQNQWNFVNEDLIEVKLEIVESRDIKEMIDMKFNTFKIDTDVSFRLQADDSTNPSRVHARSLPWFQRAAFYIDGYGENFTLLEFLAAGDRITCRITPGTSHKCGWGQVPRPDQASDQVLIESLYFGPRATGNGASAYQDRWEANRYTWHGSYYYVYAK